MLAVGLVLIFLFVLVLAANIFLDRIFEIALLSSLIAELVDEGWE